jgi:hypothetical protein
MCFSSAVLLDQSRRGIEHTFHDRLHGALLDDRSFHRGAFRASGTIHAASSFWQGINDSDYP